MTRALAGVCLAALAGCVCQAPAPTTIRVATFNASLYRDGPGALLADAAAGDDVQLAGLAAILQEVRPDVVLLQEVDHDPDGALTRSLVERWIGVGQGGRAPLRYAYHLSPEVNTGAPSGLDLDGDGVANHPVGTPGYGADAWGYGRYPGQYGMLVLSRFPLGAARAWRTLRWVDLPGATLPDDPATPAPADFYAPEVRAALRLSSKTHVAVPVHTPAGTVTLLASHPTPPVFDGPEDRNGLRNADELRLWTVLLDGQGLPDDAGDDAPLDAPAFVLLGDLNNDPLDGDGVHQAVRDLLTHPAVGHDPAPRSDGAAAQAAAQGGRNAEHRGPPAEDTIDADDAQVGNLRLDYVLPSATLTRVGAGVFWPLPADPLFSLVGVAPFPVSDHRLVWVDVRLPPAADG